MSRIGTSIQTGSKLGVAVGDGDRTMGIDCLMGRGLTSGAMKVFRNEIKVVFAQHHTCIKCHWFAFKRLVLCYLTFASLKGNVSLKSNMILSYFKPSMAPYCT